MRNRLALVTKHVPSGRVKNRLWGAILAHRLIGPMKQAGKKISPDWYGLALISYHGPTLWRLVGFSNFNPTCALWPYTSLLPPPPPPPRVESSAEWWVQTKFDLLNSAWTLGRNSCFCQFWPYILGRNALFGPGHCVQLGMMDGSFRSHDGDWTNQQCHCYKIGSVRTNTLSHQYRLFQCNILHIFYV